MRQAGVFAAAGLYALGHHVDRLADDHARARRLAAAVGEAAPAAVDAAAVETNIVPLDLTGAPYDARGLARAAKDEGVLVSVLGPRKARLVTHLDVDDADVERAGKVLSRLLAG